MTDVVDVDVVPTGLKHLTIPGIEASRSSECHDTFDTGAILTINQSTNQSMNQASPRSPSPTSAQSNLTPKFGLSESRSFYQPINQTINQAPDAVTSIDRSLLPIIAPFNYLDAATLTDRANALNVSKRGYMFKRQNLPMLMGGNRYRFNKRFVTLRDNHLRYDSSMKASMPKGDMDLAHVSVNHDKCEINPDLLILDVTRWYKRSKGRYVEQSERCFELRCNSEQDRNEWIHAINESKMMFEVYPLVQPGESQPFPIALVLGCPQSAKSTIFRHMMAWRPASIASEPVLNRSVTYSSLSPRIGEDIRPKPGHKHRLMLSEEPNDSEGYVPIEVRLTWKKRIYLHLLRGLCVLADACDQQHSDHIDSEFVYAHHVLSDQAESVRTNEDEHMSLDAHSLEYVHRVLNEPLVQQVMPSLQLSDPYVRTLKHYLDQLDHIVANDWIPTFVDIIHCYSPLTAMAWKQIDPHTPHRFRVYDIGGSQPMDRVERWKLERFQAASFVVFTVDLTAYARPSTVDPQLNGLQESLILYQQLLACPRLNDWGTIHVYFTFSDLLKQTLAQTPFAEQIQSYTGENTKSVVIRTQMSMFAKIGGTRYAGRVVNALDRVEMSKSLNEDIEAKREAIKQVQVPTANRN